MSLQGQLHLLVATVFYPLWLGFAGIDYLCHRRTDIENNSGWRESALHLAQYLCIAPTVVLAAFFTMGGLVLWFACVAMVLHTAVAYVDVRYTIPRRFISALEQHVHGVLTAVPPIAVAVLALADRDIHQATMRGTSGLSSGQLALVIASAIAAGLPIIEEIVRTFRKRNVASTSH